MTIQQANDIKKLLKGSYDYYFKSKTGELRVRVFRWDYDYKSDIEHDAIIKLLNTVSAAGYRPRFHVDRKKYQQGLNETFVVFE